MCGTYTFWKYIAHVFLVLGARATWTTAGGKATPLTLKNISPFTAFRAFNPFPPLRRPKFISVCLRM